MENNLLKTLREVFIFFIDAWDNYAGWYILDIVSHIYTLSKKYLPKFLCFIFFIPLWIIAFFLDVFLMTLLLLLVITTPPILVLIMAFIAGIKEKEWGGYVIIPVLFVLLFVLMIILLNL